MINDGGPQLQIPIKKTPATPPACPAPAMGIAAEVVTSIATPVAILKIAAADAPNTLIVAITLKKDFTERKEVRMGYTIVFKDDALAFILKKPADGTDGPNAAALVFQTEQVLYMARPIDLFLDDFTGCGDFFFLVRAGWIGAIAGHIEAIRSISAHGVNDLTRCMRAAPGNEQNGYRHARGARIRRNSSWLSKRRQSGGSGLANRQATPIRMGSLAGPCRRGQQQAWESRTRQKHGRSP